jgi:hypothetical protein
MEPLSVSGSLQFLFVLKAAVLSIAARMRRALQLVLRRGMDVLPCFPASRLACRFSSGVEQLIRNERVNGSNPLSGFPLKEGFYLLNPKDFGGFSA